MSLTVELSIIPQEGLSQRFTSTAVALGIIDSELAVVQPIEIDCQLDRVNDEVVVRGRLQSAVRLACSRCAEEFTQSLDVALDAVYLPTEVLSSGQAKAFEEDETELYGYIEQLIDLTEMVRDKVFLSIPLQPHCRVECKGLCPSCGVNRNTLSCQCAEEKLGSPFAPLKGLHFS
jgi:DUF177 domain-containing protein